MGLRGYFRLCRTSVEELGRLLRGVLEGKIDS